MAPRLRTTGPGLLRGYSHGHRRVVVCFHHAGGGMSAYRGWAQALAPVTDVVLVQLKGREDRIAEPLTDHLDDLALDIARGVCAMPYDDVVLLGHSMGATLAWAVADAVWSVYRRRVQVVVSAQAPPPYDPAAVGALFAPGDGCAGAMDVFEGVGGTAAGAVGTVYADTLDADLAWMSREFPALPVRALPVDLYCVAAEQDRLLAPSAMAGWASLTTRRFTRSTVPGGHMYLLADPSPLVRLVKELALRDSAERTAVDGHPLS
ncbi:thioesterase II family protein [Streptacidiphilus cavernicola]|uniref:Thioesterase II family protein n=1 Tax=Streptacidiphilus cavernicola TaxID=3342716 RepID=A0ABV6VYQ4_9ACTN